MPVKPAARVVSIAGATGPDIIRQSEFSEICEIQDEDHAVGVRLSQRVLSIEQRLLSGAMVEPGDLYFDRKRKMVRTRKDEKRTGS